MDNTPIQSRRGRPPMKKEVPKERKMVEPADSKMVDKKDQKGKPPEKKNGVDLKDLKTKIKEIEKSQKDNMKSLDKITKLVAKMR